MATRTIPLGVALTLIFGCAACTTSQAGKPVPERETVTVTSLVTPSTAPSRRKAFDASAVERGVVQILSEEYKISDVGRASCPRNQEVIVGTSFVCRVSIGGAVKSVMITVKSADGEYEVGQPTG